MFCVMITGVLYIVGYSDYRSVFFKIYVSENVLYNDDKGVL